MNQPDLAAQVRALLTSEKAVAIAVRWWTERYSCTPEAADAVRRSLAVVADAILPDLMRLIAPRQERCECGKTPVMCARCVEHAVRRRWVEIRRRERTRARS